MNRILRAFARGAVKGTLYASLALLAAGSLILIMEAMTK